VQLISIGLDVHALNDTRKEKKDILSNIDFTDITASCKYIVENEQSVRKTLNFSKAANIAARAQAIVDGQTSQEDAIAFIKICRRRIHTKYNLDVAKLSAKVAGVAMAAISLFVPPNPVTLGIAGISAVTQVALFGLGKLLLNKDPFSAPRDVWYAQLADKVREHAGRLTDAISARQLQPVA
jgi:hypothetical protein